MDLRKSLMEYLRSQATVELAVVFGSLARRAGSPSSDVDVGLRIARSADSRQLRREIEVGLGRAAKRDVDLVFLDDAPPLLRLEIARDGRVLIERKPNAWTDFKAQAMIDWWDWEPIARSVNRLIHQRLQEKASDGSP